MAADEILEKLPKKTPIWAIGITTVIVGLTTCIVTVYLVGKDEIRQHLTWAENSRAESLKQESKSIDSILAIVSRNMEHMAELNKALGLSQLEASNLAVRVSDCETAINRLKTSLTSCEDSLKKCIERSK